MKIDWKGAAVIAKITRATHEAIDETTQAAADVAKSEHDWQRKSGELEANTIIRPAQQEGPTQITGKFGSTNREGGFYGLFQEMREPWLRPAADKEFPKLAERIAEKTDA